MDEVFIRQEDDFIKLGQVLKKSGVASTGAEAKLMIEDGCVLVNGEVELQRGKKIREGDVISGDGWSFKVVK